MHGPAERSEAFFAGYYAVRPLTEEDHAAISPFPVSYTHLRAHATVLDLVCRLLLEKKKPKLNTAVLTC